MPESLAHWFTFAGGMIVQAIIAAFVYGKLTQTVNGMGEVLKTERLDRKEEISRIDREQEQQWYQINANDVSLAKVKGKLGINGN